MTVPLFPAADPGRRAAISSALQRCGLDPTLIRSVDSLLDRLQDDWRVCCGSGCEPCVLPLGRAVDMARAELGIGQGAAEPPLTPDAG